MNLISDDSLVDFIQEMVSTPSYISKDAAKIISKGLTDKFYPQADDWMWNYCTYLGKFTDSLGVNYDLGVYIDGNEIINATVFSNTPGDYNSMSISRHFDKSDKREFIQEVYKRLKKLNIIKNND